MLDFVVLHIESVIWGILIEWICRFISLCKVNFSGDKFAKKTSPVPLQNPILIIAQAVHFMRAFCSSDINIRTDG